MILRVLIHIFSQNLIKDGCDVHHVTCELTVMVALSVMMMIIIRDLYVKDVPTLK